MNWYKKSQRKEEIERNFSIIFWEIINTIDGNWTIESCRFYTGANRVMVKFNGFSPNPLNTKQGFFTGNLLIVLSGPQMIDHGDIFLSGMIYEGEQPNKDWRSDSLFLGKFPQMRDLLDVEIHSLEEIKPAIESSISYFWGDDNDPKEEYDPVAPPSTGKQYEAKEKKYELV